MKNDIKCFFGLHHYQVYKEFPLLLAGTNTEIGKVIISRCANCGKIKEKIVRTIDRVF